MARRGRRVWTYSGIVGHGFEMCCPEHILEAAHLGSRLLLHSWARNRLVTTWDRRQEIRRAERSPTVNRGIHSRREKCDKRHLTDRKGKSKSVHSLLVTYEETEAENAVSSLALAPWLELGMKLCFPEFTSLPAGHGPCSSALFSMLLPVSVMCCQLFLKMVPVCPAAIPAYIPHI